MADDIVRLDDQPDDEVAQLLRQALRAEADEVTPGDRFASLLDQIEESEAEEGQLAGGGWFRWLAPAAIVALALGLSVPLVLGMLRGQPDDPAGLPPSPDVPSVTPTTSVDPSGQSSLPTTQRQLAIYYLGADGLLQREFHDLPTQTDRLTTAVAAVLNVAPFDPAYTSGWVGGQVNSATLEGNQIVLDLSSSAFGNFTDERSAELAVRQVVYTASGAVGDRSGEKTVKILIDGSATLPVLGTPTTDFVREGNVPLGLLWVTVPETGQKLSRGRVRLSGYLQVTVAVPTIDWSLTKGTETTALHSGQVAASGDEAGWRSWQIPLELEPGDYTLTLKTEQTEVVKTFTVTG
ncbi:GerMN domain-containing protein [Aestuariimicrobium ganziense]|uniref:GerMN domain-containing protein n=1 Tax=Aestuariimicrobium ganziense TaxID=2773677 RepID=UPI0019444B7E|nr:GerMN domain-containing protein [Aestuariimicrobium ganziense]